MPRKPLPHWPAYLAALIALLLVFGLYLRPAFMVTLAQQVWACF